MAVNRDPKSSESTDLDRADTSSRILDVAERLVQLRGFNGFSYADVASELKITKASLHYHYPGKADLGRALVERYASRFAEHWMTSTGAARSDSQARGVREDLRRCAA